MAGFFKKLFNRIVGKKEEEALSPPAVEQVALPAPEPAPEPVAPEPEPIAIAEVAPAAVVADPEPAPELVSQPQAKAVKKAPTKKVAPPPPKPSKAVKSAKPERKPEVPEKSAATTKKVEGKAAPQKLAPKPPPKVPESKAKVSAPPAPQPPSKAPVKKAVPKKAETKLPEPIEVLPPPKPVAVPDPEPIVEAPKFEPPQPPEPEAPAAPMPVPEPRVQRIKPFAKASAPQPTPEAEPERKGWFSRLKEGLSKSSKSISGSITSIFTKRKLDTATLQELEDTLIQADLGITVSERIIKAVSTGRYDKEIDPEEVKRILADEVAKVLRPVEVPFNFGTEKPYVILVVGVNGSGKTTTIGKLGAIAAGEGFKVKFAACDTFRAAAIEQLTVWGKRIGAETISRPQGADAAGLAFDAMKAAKEDGTDILFIDTAGRLHNKTYLMDELDKVVRVIKKYDEAAPHAVLLVLDATTGQNALAQAEAFTKVAGVTGLIMTKLDGTARGGILVAIAEKFKLPIHAVGVGETVDDLQPFDADGFSRAIAGLED
jgi:fused signal recognition particle receptor